MERNKRVYPKSDNTIDFPSLLVGAGDGDTKELITLSALIPANVTSITNRSCHGLYRIFDKDSSFLTPIDKCYVCEQLFQSEFGIFTANR